MANIFDKGRDLLDHFIIVMWPVGLLACIVATGLQYEDLTTTYKGWAALPINHGEWWVGWLVALFLYLPQLIGLYIYGQDTDSEYATYLSD